MADTQEDTYPTRQSLLHRLANPDDQQSWQEFHDRYSRLIFGFALKAGLTESEAQEVVQETMIAVAKNLPKFHYDPLVCSFKTWLLNLSRWRVIDQLRKRLPSAHQSPPLDEETARTATIDRVADPVGSQLDLVWDQEWHATLLEEAIAKVKVRVDGKQWQIFDLYVLKGQSAWDVAKAMGVNPGQVYLAKYRIGSRLKKELTQLETLRV
jgi:RNA polymerase sigma factor (sigma-70 family)